MTPYKRYYINVYRTFFDSKKKWRYFYIVSRQEETRFQLVSNSQVRRDKMKNNNVTEKDLFYILDLFEHMKVTYWLDGGWGG